MFSHHHQDNKESKLLISSSPLENVRAPNKAERQETLHTPKKAGILVQESSYHHPLKICRASLHVFDCSGRALGTLVTHWLHRPPSNKEHHSYMTCGQRKYVYIVFCSRQYRWTGDMAITARNGGVRSLLPMRLLLKILIAPSSFAEQLSFHRIPIFS